MTDTRTKVQVSIKDVGFGISQVLPIVVQVYNVDNQSTLIIEQPEIHLQAKAQAELTDLFINAVDSPIDLFGNQKRIIVETHSELILLRLQRRLAESFLNHGQGITTEQVAVYYIENPEGTSIAHKIEISPRGEIVTEPEGFKRFFSYDFEEISKLHQTIAKIKKRETPE